MSDLLAIGTSGLLAYRSALSAVGENVANAETPGFARRTVHLREAAAANGTSIVYRDQAQFGGVELGSIGRAWDAFRAADSRLAAAAAARSEVRAQWLGQAETSLDQGGRSVGMAATQFFSAATALAANPGDPLGRSLTLMALQDAASVIRGTAESLARVSGGIESAARIEVDALNGALGALANINGTIRQLPPGTTTRVSLEDERDRLIDQIAAKVDIEVHINAEGAATLTLAGASGTTLIGPSGRGIVAMSVADDGRLSLTLSTATQYQPLPATGGSLAGLAEAAAHVADQRAELNALAAGFVTAVNGWSAAGEDANGAPGGDLLSMTGDARSIASLVTDPALLAAAAPGGAANGNLLALDGLRGQDGIEARWTNLVSRHAQAVSNARSEASAAATWRDNSFGARDQISGVDLDFEAAELLRFQQAYNGSARIIQVARETMNTVLDLF